MTCLTQVQVDKILNETAGLKSRRMKILEGLKILLNTILESNNYAHDVSEVSFNVNGWQARVEGDTPVIYIIDDGIPEIQRMAGKQRQIKWKILLFGVVKGFDIYEFEEHIADVQECVEQNGWLGGLASKIEVTNIVTDDQLFSEKEDMHLYEISLQIEYIQCHGDAR